MRSKTSAGGQSGPTFIEAARREQIVGCAIDTLGDVGYARASLAEIAKRAGISKSVISYYFASKEELIGAVVASVYGLARAIMLPAIETQPDPAAMLRTYIETNIAFLRDYPRQVRALLEISYNTRADDAAATLATHMHDATADIEAVLRWGQETGAFRPFEPHSMAVALRASLDALTARIGNDTVLDADTYASVIAEAFHRATTSAGIAPSPRGVAASKPQTAPRRGAQRTAARKGSAR